MNRSLLIGVLSPILGSGSAGSVCVPISSINRRCACLLVYKTLLGGLVFSDSSFLLLL